MEQSEHVQKATKNEAFARWLQTTDPASADWCGTAFFYSALHWIDAYLHQFLGKKDYNSHKERQNDLEPYGGSPRLPDEQLLHYDSLRNLGRRARYQVVTLDSNDVSTIVTRHFDPLVQFIKTRLRS